MIARGLAVQSQVVYALILRETRTRFGQHNLGYLWAVLEPIGTIAVLAVLMAEGLRHSVPAGMSVFAFLATGFIPYHFFSDVNSRVVGATKSNRGLLYYPRVMPIDLMVSRLLLEIATQFTVFLIILFGDALWFEQLALDNVLDLFIGLGLAAALGTGLGSTLSGVISFWPTVDRVYKVALTPLFFVSGVWFTANELPPDIAELLLYNPVLHCTELVRSGWFQSYESRHADALYPLAWATVLIFIGLTLERVTRRRTDEE